MRRRWRIATVAGLAVAAALAFQPWRLAERTVERHLLAQLSESMGVALDSSGDGAFALLPTPRVIANDVVFATSDGALKARIPRMRAEIHLLALMAGRIAFDQITLTAPQIEVMVPAEGVDPFAIITSSRLAQLPGSPHISIRENGAIFFRRGPGIISSARDVNLDIAARETGEPMETSGSLTWRGEKVSFAVATNSPKRATLPMASIKSSLLALEFVSARASSGTPSPTIDGSVAITAPSMSRLSAWLASGSAVLLPLGRTDIRGEIRIGPDGAQIRNAALMLGSDSLEGALDWRRRDGRWRLTGTFAGQNLDIGRAQAGIDLHHSAWPDPAATAPLDVDDLLAHDIDLRLSVQRMRFPRMTLSDVAAQIMATDKRLDIAVANAGLYRGSLRGRASIGHSSTGVEIRSTLTADKVDLGLMSADLFETRRMTGQGTFQQQVEMNGRSPAELIASAEGRATFTARNGDFLGTNLNELMRRIERQPLAAARDMRGGRTSFEQLTLAGAISEGVLMLTEARGAGPAFRMAIEGRVSLIDQLYRLQGEVQSSTGQAALPFEVLGPLGEPMVQVNARSLLERSGAAAPFLRPRAN